MGMIIVGIFIIYCIIGLAVSIITYKFTKKVKYLILVIIFFTLLPTWDLLIQKAVKEYYVTFKMEPKIYAYPEKDENGKIESLGLVNVTNKLNKDLYKHNLYDYYSKYVDKFVELTTYDAKAINKEEKIRIYLNEQKYKFEKIKKQTARYIIKESKPISCVFDLCEKYTYKIIDTKNNILLAEVIKVYFTNNNFAFYFRQNILSLGTINGLLFYNKSIENIDNFNKMTIKILKIKLH